MIRFRILRGWFLGSLLAANAALAHGGGLIVRSLTFVDNQPQSMLAGTSAGALFTSDRGAHWEWICEEAIGYGQNDIPVWAVSKQGTFFAAALKGLYASRDHGCTWTAQPDFASTGAKDIQVDAQGTLYVTTQRYSAVNGLFISKDDGATFSPTPISNDHLFVSSVRVSPSRLQRIYVAAWWFEAPATSVWFVSDDSGQTFSQRDVSAEQGGGGPFAVLAVHPTRPEIVLAALTYDSGNRPSFLLRSENGGATFTQVLTGADAYNSAAFNADGRVAWVAAGNALYRSDDGGKTFAAQPAPTRNACVQTRGDDVFACGWSIVDGWGLGLFSDACPNKWEALFRYERIGAVKNCPAGSPVHDVCTPLLPALQATVPVDLPYDAGCGNLGEEPSDAGPGTTAVKSCGCGSASALSALGALGVLAFLRKRQQTR
ncbi:MAG: hypothetical protein K1X64_05360 [Myxococcaceae bacterium]|nr:hypothetical protein [Myxococcaceae bacterium]